MWASCLLHLLPSRRIPLAVMGVGGVLLSSLTTGSSTLYLCLDASGRSMPIQPIRLQIQILQQPIISMRLVLMVAGSNTDSITVTVHPLPVVNAGNDLTFSNT